MDARGVLAEYWDVPPITRVYTTLCVLTTVIVQLDLVTPFHLYFNPWLIFVKFQWWRLFSSFCFFGTFGFSFLFNMLFTYRYCRSLEETSFRNRPADFAMMFLFGATFMTICALFVHMVFLGHAFTIMLVYVWSRRNPHVRMNFFGIITFNAPYLPYVLFAFSLLLGNSVVVDFLGIAVGHFYYFLEDVFPLQQSGFKVLYTPAFMHWLFDMAANIGGGGGGGNAFEPLANLDDEGAPGVAAAAGGFDLRNAPRNVQNDDDNAHTSDEYTDGESDDEHLRPAHAVR